MYIVESEWSEECIDFTLMNFFLTVYTFLGFSSHGLFMMVNCMLFVLIGYHFSKFILTEMLHERTHKINEKINKTVIFGKIVFFFFVIQIYNHRNLKFSPDTYTFRLLNVNKILLTLFELFIAN